MRVAATEVTPGRSSGGISKVGFTAVIWLANSAAVGQEQTLSSMDSARVSRFPHPFERDFNSPKVHHYGSPNCSQVGLFLVC